MGNCVVAWGTRERQGEEGSVKVVRCSDGEEFLFPGPVMVEDLMYGFQGMAVYASKDDDGDDNTPVSPKAELRPGDHVYYLREKPLSHESSSSSSSSDSEENSTDDLIEYGSSHAAAPAGDGANPMIASVLRVRLVMSRHELSQLLQGRHNLIGSPSSSLSSSLSSPNSDLIAKKLQLLLPTSNTPPPPIPSCPWKPSLSHIPESD